MLQERDVALAVKQEKLKVGKKIVIPVKEQDGILAPFAREQDGSIQKNINKHYECS